MHRHSGPMRSIEPGISDSGSGAFGSPRNDGAISLMAVIENTIATSSDAFRANREGMLALIARMRALEERTRDGFGRSERPLPQARAAPAARARRAGARSRLALHRAVDAGRLHVRRGRSRQERARRRRDRGHRLRLGHPLHGQRQRCRHRRRRSAAFRARQDAAGAGTRAGEQAALCAARRERRRQFAALPRRGFCPRRQHLPQSRAAVGGGTARRHGHARLLDRGRRLPDRPVRLHRDGARPHPRLSRRAAALESRDRRDRDRGRARRRGDAHLDFRPWRLSRRGRP